MSKRAVRSVTTTTELYHVKIDKRVANTTELYRILMALLGGFFSWRDRRMLEILHKRGISDAEISRELGISKTAVNKIFSKPNFIKLADEPPSLVSPDVSTSGESSADEGLVTAEIINRKDSRV